MSGPRRGHPSSCSARAAKARQWSSSTRTRAGRQGALDGALLELIYLRMSQINGCHDCLALHHQALQWAESLTFLPTPHAPDQDDQPLLAEFSAEEVADLTLACALMNAFNRLAVGMRQ